MYVCKYVWIVFNNVFCSCVVHSMYEWCKGGGMQFYCLKQSQTINIVGLLIWFIFKFIIKLIVVTEDLKLYIKLIK